MSNFIKKEHVYDGLKAAAISGGVIGLIFALIEADEDANTKPAKDHCENFAAVVASWNDDFAKKHADQEVHSRVYNQYMRNKVIKYFGIVEAHDEPET